MENKFAKREKLRMHIKRDIRCKDLLKPSKNGLYCCPMCHSGHKEHRSIGSFRCALSSVVYERLQPSV